MARADSPVNHTTESKLDPQHTIAESIKDLDVELRDVNFKVARRLLIKATES